MAHIQEASDFPALSRQIIDTISMIDDDASSLQRLANVVLREYSLTLAVVRTANTAHYRRTGRPIQSATHAMMMLGARTVRHLASSLLLFENYSRRSPVLKELMVMSLITANHAREVSTRLECSDPEEAHLCGMIRNIGEVLIACHFPDDYARIQERVHDMGQSVSAAATPCWVSAMRISRWRSHVTGECRTPSCRGFARDRARCFRRRAPLPHSATT